MTAIVHAPRRFLGDLATPRRDRVLPREYPDLPFIGMAHVEANTMKLIGTGRSGDMKASALRFRAGDVLYGRLRPYLNKVYRAEFEGLCSAEFIVLGPTPELDTKFLAHVLNSREFVAYAAMQSSGDRPRIDFDLIAPFPFPIGAQDLQAKTAGEVDLQFTRLDDAVASLHRVVDNSRRFRQALLTRAVQGELVPNEAETARSEGRTYETGASLLERKARMTAAGPWSGRRRKRARTLPTSDSCEQVLPEGWASARWSQVGTFQNGRGFPSREYAPAGIRLIRPGNLHVSGRVVWTSENTRYLPEKWRQKSGDLLVGGRELIMNLTAQSLKDEFLGRVCMTDPGEHALLNQRLARITPVGLDSRYVFWVLKSPLFRTFVNRLNTGSLIQHMFTSQLAEFVLPVPPLVEQRRIADALDAQMSLLERVDDLVAGNLQRAPLLRETLRSSALAQLSP